MNKTVLITGASRGIGRETARLFAQNGWRVAINYKNSASSAQALKGELILAGTDAETFCADVSDYAAVKKMVQDVMCRFKHIDALICNAGVAKQELFTDITPSGWSDMINQNLSSVFYCCKEILPHMISQKSGAIVNLSSIWGQNGASCEVHYSAAKAGVIGLTKALAKEVGPSGITVNAVAPGVIETDMLNGFSADDLAALAEVSPLNRLGTPADVAAAIYFLATSPFITGTVLGVNGGFGL